jgi:hypothetical protein
MNRGNALKKLGKLKEGEHDLTEANNLRIRSSREMKNSTDKGSQ